MDEATLTVETASAYVLSYYEGYDVTVRIALASATTLDGINVVKVIAIDTTGEAMEWLVWIENGKLYGEF